ncbi:MAG: hypothetical protein HY242_01425 [Afipia sp.]|nr:hypothetical protein [Afipia sp.]
MPSDLTKRELEVPRYPARGLSASETGKRLGLSGRTVVVHMSRACLREVPTPSS